MNQQKLSQIFPPLANRIRILVEAARLGGMNLAVYKGFRSIERQNYLHSIGRTIHLDRKTVTGKRGGGSWHNYGLACDLVFKTPGWNWNRKLPWERMGPIGVGMKLRWGGNFKSFFDGPHFQLTGGLTIAQAKQLNEAGGIRAVWAEVRKRLTARGLP